MYQHDNAQAHTARLTVNFLAANKILVLDWPPLSHVSDLVVNCNFKI